MASEKRELQKKNREKAIKKAKTKKLVWSIVGIVVGVAALGGIGYITWDATINTTKAIEDYSAGVTNEGLIKNADLAAQLDLCDYKSMSFNYNELAPSDEEMQSEIDGQLKQFSELSKEPGTVVNEGDKINLDYVGKVDGVEFENGSTNGAGTDIVLGSAGYIDDFEEQVMGTKVGDSYTINVTFPTDYDKEELQGKDATFDITVNGVYQTGTFDDAFVAANLSMYASTAEGYKQYYNDKVYNERLRAKIIAYIVDNSTVKEYPNGYLKTMRGKAKYYDEISFERTNQQYIQYFGQSFYKDLYEFKNMKKSEYEASLVTQAETNAKNSMVVQAIYQDAGLQITQDDLNAAIKENWDMEPTYYNQAVEQYGEGAVKQSAIGIAVMNYLMESAQIVK